MVKHSSGREYWRRTDVDVDRHVLVFDKPLSDDPSISDQDSVNDYLSDLSVSSPLSTDKPLWEIHLLMAHNCLVFRLHHALGDGISLMSMLLSCCRRADDPSQLPTIGGVGTSSTTRRRWSLWTLMKVVWYTLVYVLEFMLRALWLKDKKTVISGGSGVELWPRKLATAKFRLDDMKIVKKAITDARVRFPFSSRIIHGMNSWSPSSELTDSGDSEFGVEVCRNLDFGLSLGLGEANLMLNLVVVEEEEHVMRVRRWRWAIWDRKVDLERRRVVKT
ncbi:unnamed protein product [Fraxinus pennsylvanica]|uniref:diacylglycerol O-acyltransferase n=1 Tax=Fraxinus pennsylvanica TaxID=56036 RepID=A0AAD1ZMH8_9LAMI|nr:unnamed protein product [Fraxinus pennsylvanica]